MKPKSKKFISIFLIELIILLPIAIIDGIKIVSAQQHTQLFVNAPIPNYYNSNSIDVQGNSLGLARINMYVNNNPVRTLNADNNGNFLFRDVNLNEGDNTIRFTAQSQGLTVQNDYTITVDTILPIVTMDEIPDIIGDQRLLIEGSVSELVDVLFYVTTGEEDTIPPPKILNLRNTTVQANLVELSWDDLNIGDFQQYIVYRNNQPLGIGPDSGYSDYSDVLANSGQTYTYEVTAMDKNGNIGERSNPIIVTTPEGGRTDLPEELVNIYESLIGLQTTVTTDSTFSEEVPIGREDGFYNIKIEALDIAENSWIYEKEVLLDTKDPEIEILTPRSNAEIYEQYADLVTIRGKTEPGSRVYLYVKRTPFGLIEDTVDIYGFPDELQQLSEADLRANCRINIQGEEQCKTHADYETVADAQGYFEFEDVDLTSMWAGAFRIRELPTGEPYYDLVNRDDLRNVLESNLIFIAVDPASRKGIQQIDYRIRSCWSDSLTWDVMPLIEYQSPTFLNVERLKEGTESIYFYFNFTYHGIGEDARVTNLIVQDACGRDYLENQERYNYSCSIIRSCTEKLSPKGRTAYIACPLGRLEGIEKWADADWEDFINAVKDEMTFPFKITMDYDEEFENGTIGRSKRYNLCTEVGYAVDAARINPQDILPDWLLYDFVDILNESITKLNDWISQIRKVLEWVSIGCMVTFFVNFIMQIYRRITCDYDEFFKKIGGVLQGSGDTQQEDECRACLESEYEDPLALEKFKKNDNFQDIISDTCLQVCYPSCSAAWESEESMYQAFRWTCDRVFGHPTPSKWTETADDTKIFQKLSEGVGCANDESVRGKPLRAISCKSVENEYDTRRSFSRDDKCLEISTRTGVGIGKETLYQIGELASEGESVYRINHIAGPEALEYRHVIKQDEDNYLAPMDQSCEQMCKGDLTNEQVETGLRTAGGTRIKADNLNQVQSKTLDGCKKGENCVMTYGCTTPNQCISYKSGDTKKLTVDGQGQQDVDVKTAVPLGYTRDCFDPQYVSGDPDQRIECCCINSARGASPKYYQPGDVENKDGEFGNDGFENMKWSYRYFKEGYKDKKYNENRYIDGRDQSACFGQNLWFYDFGSGGGEGNLLMIDPMKQHIAAFQCLAISQILNRLALLKNIMGALQNCLLSIRLTGDADAGVCKEIFTQYICSFVWKIITWIRSGCLPFGSGVDLSKSDNEIAKAVTRGTRGIFDSIADSQATLASEYGNAELQNLIGIGEEQIFRKACLAAFGYDWEIDADAFVDIAYHAPYKTLVQAILPSREYLTFDPTNAQAKYEYRSSWLINPGCDLEGYEVHLACVTRDDLRENDDIDCAKQKDPYGKNCDCLDVPPERAPSTRFYYQSRGRIKQNELQNVDSTQIRDRIKTAPYRYDHLMFKLRVDRNYIENQGDISKCFPDGHEDGIFYVPITDYTAREVAGCSFDLTSGKFSCKEGASFFYEQGMARIDGVELDGDKSFDDHILLDKPAGATFYEEDYIQGKVKYSKDKDLQCLIVRLYDENGQPFKEGDKLSQTRVYQLRGLAEEKDQIFNTGYIVNKKDFVTSNQAITVSGGQLATQSATPETGLTTWILHIDIRTPKADNSCDNVKGFEYDNSQIVVVDGEKQSLDIPILLDPNKKSENACDDNFATDRIPGGIECVCGKDTENNCPDEEKGYYHCVEDKCRKYPRCVGDVTGPCICRSASDRDEYDCGYTPDTSDDFAGSDPNAQFCVNRQCVVESQLTPASTPSTGPLPLIDSGMSRIENGPNNFIPLDSGSTINVNQPFKIQVFASGRGNEVSSVIVHIPGSSITSLSPPEIRPGIWQGTIDSFPQGPYPLTITAINANGQATVTQNINVQ